MNGEQNPFPDDHFDAATQLGVLHHVPRPERLVAEMIRVSPELVCLSDSNCFGQGRFWMTVIKLTAWQCGCWPLLDLLRTRSKGYTVSEEDGLAYSYLVYDSFHQLKRCADQAYLIPTTGMTASSCFYPLPATSHVLLIAQRSPRYEMTVS